MPSSAERLLWDIEHSCARFSLFKEKYDVFKTDEGSIAIVRWNSSEGSNSLTIPESVITFGDEVLIDVSTDEDGDESWKEKIPDLLPNRNGTINEVIEILQEYRRSLHQLQSSYFRTCWFDDADNSLDSITNNNGAILFERSFNSDKNCWDICPLNRLRGGRFSKVEKQEERAISISKDKLPKAKTIPRSHSQFIGENNPLFPLLKRMCGQPNSIQQECLFTCQKNLVSCLQKLEPGNAEGCSQRTFDLHYAQVIEWLINAKFPISSLLTSGIRCSSIMKMGIDTGTRKLRFPQRGFKDSSNDEADIPREEDRNAKVFLLALAVYASGTLLYPLPGNFDIWEFRADATQEELRFIHNQAERLVLVLTEKSHQIKAVPLEEDALQSASVHRAISYLKGERKLFRHQLEGLEWCLKREQGNQRGGFIACDMGMGKTIQVLLLHLCYEKKFRGKTLVVVPPGLLRQPWYKEATDPRYWGEGNLPFGIPLLFIRGSGKGKPFPSVREISQANLIIVSYNTLASNSLLQQIPFRRVILDESTYIKTPTAQRSMATRSVRCDMHWCLSGTPIENKKEDYLGQLLFLHIAPYFHRDWWFERFDPERHRMFFHTMFKRNFQNIIDGCLIDHPAIKIPMTEEEQDRYTAEKDEFICSILGSQDVSKRGAQIMKLLRLSRASKKLKVLRDMCCALITPLKKFNDKFHKAYYNGLLLSTMLENQEEAASFIQSGKLVATRNSISAFMDTMKDIKEDKVQDMEEIELFLQMFERQCKKKQNEKPYDWKYTHTLSPQEDSDEESDEDSDSDDGPLLDYEENSVSQRDIVKLRNRDICAKEKCVVFVQGSERAKEVGEFLGKGCGCTVLVRESGTAKNAEEIIETFQRDKQARILILTYRGGAHGLNLQVARNVFLVDPDWNPAILMQAVARCYRIGQTQDVHVYTFVTEDSLEERVQLVIERKIKLIRENISAVGEDITEWEDIKAILESSVSKKK